jgi:autotransporter translocation and assembly factor TamB
VPLAGLVVGLLCGLVVADCRLAIGATGGVWLGMILQAVRLGTLLLADRPGIWVLVIGLTGTWAGTALRARRAVVS